MLCINKPNATNLTENHAVSGLLFVVALVIPSPFSPKSSSTVSLLRPPQLCLDSFGSIVRQCGVHSDSKSTWIEIENSLAHDVSRSAHSIRTEAAERSLAGFLNNKIQSHPPPEVMDSQRFLPCKHPPRQLYQSPKSRIGACSPGPLAPATADQSRLLPAVVSKSRLAPAISDKLDV